MMFNKIFSKFRKDKYINIDVTELPSMGMFYPQDFTITYKKATDDDISQYESKYIIDDYITILSIIKLVVNANIKLSNNYKFEQIKSIDMLYLFLSIVKYTKGKDISMSYDNTDIIFNQENFKYFNIPLKYNNAYDSNTLEFVYDGFRYSLPSSGAEGSISRFISDMHRVGRLAEFENSSYDFMYFLGGRTQLNNNEIENLLSIFNDEMTPSDMNIISMLIKDFKGLTKYSLMYNNLIIPFDGSGLGDIWKL